MSWTDTTRAEHKRICSRYPSDCTDEEWAIIEPLLPPACHGGPRGYDAGKKIKGRKRHIVTDANGFLVGLVVHEASIQDRDGAIHVLHSIRRFYPFLRHVFADGGYAGPKLRNALKTKGGNTPPL